ncbi:hypothetical protein GCM10023066_46040 [Nocardioides kongjuensis]
MSRAGKLIPVTDLALIAGAGALVVLTLSKLVFALVALLRVPASERVAAIRAIGDALAKWTWR